MKITVRQIEESEIDALVLVLNRIPEFDTVFNRTKILQRIGNKNFIGFVAFDENQPVACKLAYNRYFDGSIYSWLGGVLPEYRKQGIATLLQQSFEISARKKLYASIRVKTRNRHTAMLRLLLKNNFLITNFELRSNLLDARIELKKEL